MSDKSRKTITERQWRLAVETYELGYQHANRIARELGVSPSTVSREFKQRGAIKGCRVAETQLAYIAELDAKARRRAVLQEEREATLAKRSALIDAMIDDLVRSLVAASKSGSLSAVNDKIREVGGTLGVKLAR